MSAGKDANADFAARLLAASSTPGLPNNPAASDIMALQSQLAAAYSNPMAAMQMNPFAGYGNPYAMYQMQNANPFASPAGFGWPGMGMSPDLMMNMAMMQQMQQAQAPVACTETFTQAINKIALASTCPSSTTTTSSKQSSVNNERPASDLATLAAVASSLSASNSPVPNRPQSQCKTNGSSELFTVNPLKRKPTPCSSVDSKQSVELPKPKASKPNKEPTSGGNFKQNQANLQALASLSTGDIQMNPQLLNASAMAWATLLGMGVHDNKQALEASQSPGAKSDESRQSSKTGKKVIDNNNTPKSSSSKNGDCTTKVGDSLAMDETIDSVIRQQNELALDMEIKLANETTVALKGKAPTRHSPCSQKGKTKVPNGTSDFHESSRLPSGHSVTHSPLPQKTSNHEEIPLDLSCKQHNDNSAKNIDSMYRKPMEMGWRRQTCIKSIGCGGVKGDVMYFTPDGSKICSLVDVVKNFDAMSNVDLTKDNFSFNCKLLLGEFVQIKTDGNKSTINRYTEDEIKERINQAGNQAKKLISLTKIRSSSLNISGTNSGSNVVSHHSKQHKDVSGKVQQMMQTLASNQNNKLSKSHLELIQNTTLYQQMMLGLDHEKIQKFLESQFAVTQEKDNKSIKVEEEIGDVNANTNSNTNTSPILKVKPSKIPVEDLTIEESKVLPPLDPIIGLDVSGKTFADLLMVMQFIHNFGHVLRIDAHDVPPIEHMHAGLMNDSRYVAKVRQLTIVLLTLVIEYPGLPSGAGGRTLVGQVGRDVPINKDNMDELLRMFLASRNHQGKQLSLPLASLSFECLTPQRKAAILAFMCDELLYCRNVVREIESNVEEVTRLKGERWINEGRVRLLRGIQSKKRSEGIKKEEDLHEEEEREEEVNIKQEIHEDRPATPISPADSTDSDSRPVCNARDREIMGLSPPPSRPLPPGFGGSMGGKPKVMIPGIGQAETVTDQEKAMDVDQLEILINQLNSDCEDFRKGIINSSNRVRSQPIGEDRYHRLYWCLPSMQHTIMVESCESCAIANPTFDINSVQLESDPTIVNAVAKNVVDDLVNAVINTLAHTDYKHNHIQQPSTSCKSNITKLATRIPYKCQKGWWVLPGQKGVERLQKGLQMRGIRERQLNRALSKVIEQAELTCEVPSVVVSEPQVLISGLQCDMQRLNKVLQAVITFQEKILHANVHKRNWKPLGYVVPTQASTSKSAEDEENSMASSVDSTSAMSDESWSDRANLLNAIKHKLMDAESNLERRYLKQPYNHGPSPLAKLQLLNEEGGLEDGQFSHELEISERERKEVALELEQWRLAVMDCETGAMIMLCLMQMDKHIAWEKSIMRASCQLCTGGENESELLLCDGCDRGYHTYCFKPRLNCIPAGDWFCPMCVTKASNKQCCILCRKQEQPQNMDHCHECTRDFHKDCISPLKGYTKSKPTASGVPSVTWTCPNCLNKSHLNVNAPKSSRNSTPSLSIDEKCAVLPVVKDVDDEKNNFNCDEESSSMTIENGHFESTQKAEDFDESGQEIDLMQKEENKNGKKKPGRKKGITIKKTPNKEKKHKGEITWSEACRRMADEISVHKDAWPFQLAVDTRKCPLYKKVIPKPMHIKQIVSRVQNGAYSGVDDFVTDVNLVFDNCRTFNEDQSPVGKAGISLRKFFNRRWKVLTCLIADSNQTLAQEGEI